MHQPKSHEMLTLPTQNDPKPQRVPRSKPANSQDTRTTVRPADPLLKPAYSINEWLTTEAYPKELRLERFQRHLLFVKPNVLLVLDDIQLQHPREMELRFHPEPGERQQGESLLFRGQSAILQLTPLTTEDVEVAAGDVSIEDRHGGKDASMFTIRLRRNGSEWRNAVALTWAEIDQQPPEVSLDARDTQWIFQCGPQAVSFDWTTKRALAE